MYMFQLFSLLTNFYNRLPAKGQRVIIRFKLRPSTSKPLAFISGYPSSLCLSSLTWVVLGFIHKKPKSLRLHDRTQYSDVCLHLIRSSERSYVSAYSDQKNFSSLTKKVCLILSQCGTFSRSRLKMEVPLPTSSISCLLIASNLHIITCVVQTLEARGFIYIMQMCLSG